MVQRADAPALDGSCSFPSFLLPGSLVCVKDTINACCGKLRIVSPVVWGTRRLASAFLQTALRPTTPKEAAACSTSKPVRDYA